MGGNDRDDCGGVHANGRAHELHQLHGCGNGYERERAWSELLYEFALLSAARRHGLLLESMTTRVPEFVDGSGNDCHHQK